MFRNDLKNNLLGVLCRHLPRTYVHSVFFCDFIEKTKNVSTIRWLGHPIWQNPLDLWTIQETLAELRPELLIECGTNRGGSSLFFAHLFDLMSSGQIVTIDIERLHNLSHPRITYLIGSSVDGEIIENVRARVAACTGPVMVILDSDHSQEHVQRELQLYSPFVTPGSYCMVQDGVLDELPVFKGCSPGPLYAIQEFLKSADEFELDRERSQRFLITHSPMGWLRRKPNRFHPR